METFLNGSKYEQTRFRLFYFERKKDCYEDRNASTRYDLFNYRFICGIIDE